MSKLLDTFVEDWNADALKLDYYSLGYGALVDESYARNFQHSEVSSQGLRVSGLGSYGIVQALKYVAQKNYRKSLREAPSMGRKADIFHTGDVIEARLMAVMQAYGITVTHKQDEILWCGVTGHPDGMVENTVFDVKTANSGNFKRYAKKGSNGRYSCSAPLTYVTQLAVYAQALGASQAALLFYDKDTCELSIRYLDYDLMVDARERAKDIIAATLCCETVADVYENFKVPDPIAEVFQKALTGRHYAPSDLYNPFPDLLYERVSDTSGYGNERQYIVGLRTAETVERLLQ